MSVMRITCPKCAATATGTAQRPLPVGKAIKCPRCGTLFRIPSAPAPGRPRETRVQAPRLLPPVQGPPAKRVVYRVACPACKVVLKTTAAPPPGKAILCPKCRVSFITRPRQTKLAGSARPKETRLGPNRPKETKLVGPSPGKEKANGRPITILKCTSCKAVMRITGKLPPGKMFPCPRCRRPVSATARAGKPPAKKTTLGKQAPRTTLAPVRPKTKLAPKPPAVLPKGTLIRCAHCTTTFKSPQPMPLGRLLKCSKCGKPFRAAPFTPAKPKPITKIAPAPKSARPKTKVSRVPPLRKRSHVGLYALMGTAVLALVVLGLGYFDVIPLFPSRGIPDSAWEELVPPGGRCRIEMPGVPVAVRSKAHGPGGTEARKFVVERKRDDAAFFIAFSDRPKKARATLPAVYTAERDAVTSRARGRLVRESDVTCDGQPGKEFQIEFADGAMLIGRVYLVSGTDADRVYVVLAAGAGLEPGAGPAARFFDSFHIDAPSR